MANEKNHPPAKPASRELQCKGDPKEDIEDSGAWPRDHGPLQLPELAPMPPNVNEQTPGLRRDK